MCFNLFVFFFKHILYNNKTLCYVQCKLSSVTGLIVRDQANTTYICKVGSKLMQIVRLFLKDLALDTILYFYYGRYFLLGITPIPVTGARK